MKSYGRWIAAWKWSLELFQRRFSVGYVRFDRQDRLEIHANSERGFYIPFSRKTIIAGQQVRMPSKSRCVTDVQNPIRSILVRVVRAAKREARCTVVYCSG